jgi:hypothetical protein
MLYVIKIVNVLALCVLDGEDACAFFFAHIKAGKRKRCVRLSIVPFVVLKDSPKKQKQKR